MSSNGRIVVTGATGKIGSKIAKFLHDKDVPLRLIARSPGKLSAFPDAKKVQTDYADVASLDKAFGGIERAFIVSVTLTASNILRHQIFLIPPYRTAFIPSLSLRCSTRSIQAYGT